MKNLLIIAIIILSMSCTKENELSSSHEAKNTLSVDVPAKNYDQLVRVSIDLVTAVDYRNIVLPAGQTKVVIQVNEPNACCPRILSIQKY